MQNKSKLSTLRIIIIALVLIIFGIGAAGCAKSTSSQTTTTAYSTEASVCFRNEELREEHFQKHGIDMGFTSAEDYERAAAEVVNNSDSLHKIEEEDGDDVYYLESTNEFVIVSTDGYIRTYFQPDDGKAYFDRQ